MTTRRPVLTLLTCAAALALAQADRAEAEARWVVDPEASAIRFLYMLNGAPEEGSFGRVSGEGAFDAEAPDATRLSIEIDVSSLDLGDPLETAFALSSGWFDAIRHPALRYDLEALERTEGGWIATGVVTIKGVAQEVVTPVALELGETEARAQAELVVDRRDFRLGDAFSDALIDIGREVTVSIDLVARP